MAQQQFRNLINAFHNGIRNGLPRKVMETLMPSDIHGKRFKITAEGKTIHFGAYPFKVGAFIDHHDDEIRDAWYARHSKILISRNGKTIRAIDYPLSPDYYSARVLW
jgi:hypothetical protein